MGKTRLFLVVAAIFSIVAVGQLFIDERFVLSLMLVVALGIFVWHWIRVPFKLHNSAGEPAETERHKRSQEGETLFADNLSAALRESQTRNMRLKPDQRILGEAMLADSIINSLPGIFYFYDRDGRFLRWNKNFETVSGYTGEEVSTMHPLNFFQDDEKPLLKERIDEVFTKGRSDVTADFYTKDKRRIPYYFNGRKVNFNGTAYLIGMGLDISDRVRVEHALIERNEQIEKLSAHFQNIREEEGSRIALEIHDVLGQQLTALKMDSNWLRRRTEDEASGQRITSMIELIDETIRTVRKIHPS